MAILKWFLLLLPPIFILSTDLMMLKCSPLWKTTPLVWPAETELCGGAQERRELGKHECCDLFWFSLDFLSLGRCDRLRLHFLCSGWIPRECTEKSGSSPRILLLACPSQSVPRCSLTKGKPTFLFLGLATLPSGSSTLKKTVCPDLLAPINSNNWSSVCLTWSDCLENLCGLF